MASKVVQCPSPCGCIVNVMIACPDLSQDEINRGCEPHDIEHYGAAVGVVSHCGLEHGR